MKHLWKEEKIGNRIERYWQHYGDDGNKKITVETVEDVEPVFDSVKQKAQSPKSELRYKCSIPFTLIDETAKISAKVWGVSVRQAFSEILSQKTDRAKKALKVLTDGRDYNKLHAKTYQ